MNSKDFVLEESPFRMNLECESQASRDCVKVLKPLDPAWFRPSAKDYGSVANREEAMVMCQPCMRTLIAFEAEMRAKKLPRRRWRVHYQLPGQAAFTRSFELQHSAFREVEMVQYKGGRAMVEDRWNQT